MIIMEAIQFFTFCYPSFSRLVPSDKITIKFDGKAARDLAYLKPPVNSDNPKGSLDVRHSRSLR